MSVSERVVHLAFLPSAGIGHLNPCLRIAALFLRYGCKVTLITPKPTVSLAESNLISRFCSSFPHQVTRTDLNLIPLDPTTVNTSDPFWLQFETIRRSVHLLAPILSSLSTPLSAFIYDVSLISPLIPVTEKLTCPSYIYFTSSARMLSFFAHQIKVHALLHSLVMISKSQELHHHQDPQSFLCFFSPNLSLRASSWRKAATS